MMGKQMSEQLSGEQIERKLRRRFWATIVAFLLIGAVGGSLAGWSMAMSEQGRQAALSPVMVWSLLGGMLAAFWIGCWIYYRSIDEVDLLDNLWGSTAGFSVYVTLFGSWQFLNLFDVAAEPDHQGIFAASMIAAMAVYLWRKWRAR